MIQKKIKVTYDFDENEYCVFAEGLGLEGRGLTETRAMLNFLQNYEDLNEKFLDKSFVEQMLRKLEQNEF